MPNNQIQCHLGQFLSLQNLFYQLFHYFVLYYLYQIFMQQSEQEKALFSSLRRERENLNVKLLFGRKLDFISYAEDGDTLNQHQQAGRKSNKKFKDFLNRLSKEVNWTPPDDIDSKQALETAYIYYRALIHRCKMQNNCFEPALQKTLKQFCRGNKRQEGLVKQYLQQKAKCIISKYCLKQSQKNRWAVVLNYENIKQFYELGCCFLRKIVEKNFSSPELQIYNFKSQKLSIQSKIHICILVTDICNLLQAAKKICFPSELKNESMQKKQLQFFEAHTNNKKAHQDILFYKQLNYKRFGEIISNLADQVFEPQETVKIKLWIKLEEIKRLHLWQEQNLCQEQTRRGNFFMRVYPFWLDLAQFCNDENLVGESKFKVDQNDKRINKFFKLNFSIKLEKVKLNQRFVKVEQRNEPIKIQWLQIFSNYRYFFRSIIYGSQNKYSLSEQSSLVIQFLSLIEQTWGQIDYENSWRIFIQQLVFYRSSFNNIENLSEIGEALQQSIFQYSSNILGFYEKQWQNMLANEIEAEIKNLPIIFLQQIKVENLTKALKNMFKRIRSLLNKDTKIEIKQMTLEQSLAICEKYEQWISQNIDLDKEKEKPNVETGRIQDLVLQFISALKRIRDKKEIDETLVEKLKILFENGKRSNQVVKQIEYFLRMSRHIFHPQNQLKNKQLKDCQLFYSERKKYLLSLAPSKKIQKEKNSKDIIFVNVLISLISFQSGHPNPQTESQLRMCKQKEVFKKLEEYKFDFVREMMDKANQEKNKIRKILTSIKFNLYKENFQMTDQQVQAIIQMEQNFENNKVYQGWMSFRKINSSTKLKIIKSLDPIHNLTKLVFKIYEFYERACLSEDCWETIYSGLKKLHPKETEEIEKTHINVQKIVKSLHDLQQIKKITEDKLDQLTLESRQSEISEVVEQPWELIQDKVKIISYYNLGGSLKTRKYIIQMQNQGMLTKIQKKIQTLKKLNRSLQVEQKKNKYTITIDHSQYLFETYSDAVKHLIKQYNQLIKFCEENYEFSLYPLIHQRHISFKKIGQDVRYQFSPYEGIIMSFLTETKDLVQAQYYNYPQYPFIHLATLLQHIFFKKDKIYKDHIKNAQYYAFVHMLEEMKAISMQEEEGTNLQILKKKILKCPYFWSTSDKLFQVVQFKERYQRMINVEECRRKYNEEKNLSLPLKKEDPSEYKQAYGLHKTAQVYFSIQGLLEKQAILENICNIEEYNEYNEKKQGYRYESYFWYKNKPDLDRFFTIVARNKIKRQLIKEGKHVDGEANKKEIEDRLKDTIYKMTFPSFQNHIRSLRNFSVHYLYDDENRRQYDAEEKIKVFENYFPKIFVFLYKWSPFLGKDYFNDIKVNKIKFLKEVFPRKTGDNQQIINILQGIPELKKYKIENKSFLKKQLFDYSNDRINKCDTCKYLCLALNKESFWHFLDDMKRESYKIDEKSNLKVDQTYNLLFWQHKPLPPENTCNGLNYLVWPFYSTTQRKKFTPEDYEELQFDEYVLYVDDTKSESSQKKKKKLSDLSKEEVECLRNRLIQTDYVYKGFIFQLQTNFPFLFEDLRKYRYLWDQKANAYPEDIEI